jgi:hypothetical protein
MVAFLFLFAPTVVLIAVLIIQRFQPKPSSEALTKRVRPDDRIEPRFSAVNDNNLQEPDSKILMDDRT